MQELIRREFAGYTIIAVDHHLENILGFDKIAVFDTGMLVEFGVPEELLGRASALRELYGRRSVGEVKEITLMCYTETYICIPRKSPQNLLYDPSSTHEHTAIFIGAYRLLSRLYNERGPI